MAGEMDNQEKIKRYMLREASEEESQEVEIRLMTDDEFAEEVSIVEDELVDEYVEGGLSAEQRERFETGYLATPQGKEHLTFAMALKLSLERAQQPGEVRRDAEISSMPPAIGQLVLYKRLSIAAIGLAVVLVVLAAWLAIRIDRANNQIGRLNSDLAVLKDQRQPTQEGVANRQTEVSQPDEEIKARKTQAEPGSTEKKAGGSKENGLGVIAQTLSPGRLRGGAGSLNPIPVPAGAKLIRLKLILPPGTHHPSYRAVVKSGVGKKIVLPDTLTASHSGKAASIIAPLPIQNMDNGDYSLNLFWGDPDDNSTFVSSYFFRLLKE